MSLEAEMRAHETRAFVLFQLFQRVVAVFCLLTGLHYWAMLVGLAGGELWRFDLMPNHWRAAASALAVLLPVAAVGLWMPVSWGPVVWFVAAACETVMYIGFPELFGARTWVVLVHLAVGLTYAVFRGMLFLEKRRARRPVTVDSL